MGDRPAGETGEERPRSHWAFERGRGAAFDRVAYFSDAVFAIAMTLLIVSIETPELTGEVEDPRSLLEPLADLGPQLFSFFLAFLLLGRYWMAHHTFFASLKTVDRRLIGLNLIYLAFVAFLPFPTELVGKFERNPISVVLFALTLAAISGMESIIFRHAHRDGHLDRPLSEAAYRYGMAQSVIPVVVFLISVPIAMWSPTVALLSWLLSIPIALILERRSPDQAREYLRRTDPQGSEC
ncbi:MAG: TMEM175 family protein [Actinomycetota bacterium]